MSEGGKIEEENQRSERRGHAMLLALKMKRGPQAEVCQQPLEPGKGKEMDSPLEF